MKCYNVDELTDAFTFLSASLKSYRPVALILFISTDAMSVKLLIGIIAASTDKFLRSAPEKPLERRTSSSISF